MNNLLLFFRMRTVDSFLHLFLYSCLLSARSSSVKDGTSYNVFGPLFSVDMASIMPFEKMSTYHVGQSLWSFWSQVGPCHQKSFPFSILTVQPPDTISVGLWSKIHERALSWSVFVEESFILTASNAQKSFRHELLNIESSALLNPRNVVEISLEEYVSIVKKSRSGAAYSFFALPDSIHPHLDPNKHNPSDNITLFVNTISA